MIDADSNENGSLTSEQVARILSITPATVRVWSRKNQLPYFKLPNGEFRYLRDEIEQWIEARHGSSEQNDDE